MRDSDVLRYIDAATELEVAEQERRASLVPPDAVVRLGQLAFAGDDGQGEQAIVDSMVTRAVKLHFYPEKSAEIEKVGAELFSLAPELLGEFSQAFAEHAARHVTRIAGASVQGDRENRKADWWCGLWDSKATYGRDAVTTYRGTFWISQADGNTDPPGANASWQMMLKGGASRSQWESHKPGAAI